MITIGSATKKVSPINTLNDIPVGATFRGTVTGKSGTEYSGLFYKVWGPFFIFGRLTSGSVPVDLLVVSLDRNPPEKSIVFTVCCPVRDYVEVDISITEVGK